MLNLDQLAIDILHYTRHAPPVLVVFTHPAMDGRHHALRVSSPDGDALVVGEADMLAHAKRLNNPHEHGVSTTLCGVHIHSLSKVLKDPNHALNTRGVAAAMALGLMPKGYEI